MDDLCHSVSSITITMHIRDQSAYLYQSHVHDVRRNDHDRVRHGSALGGRHLESIHDSIKRKVAHSYTLAAPVKISNLDFERHLTSMFGVENKSKANVYEYPEKSHEEHQFSMNRESSAIEPCETSVVRFINQ